MEGLDVQGSLQEETPVKKCREEVGGGRESLQAPFRSHTCERREGSRVERGLDYAAPVRSSIWLSQWEFLC
jgi:hypothetical protein